MTEGENTREQRIDNYMKNHRKSIVIALLLTILFGPLGYLYVSVLGGVAFLVLAILLGMVSPAFAAIIWALAVLFAPIEAMGQNRKIRAQAELMAGD